MTPHRAQSGNVLFYILLCIALFAALGYAFSRGSTGGTQAISDEKAKLYASEIITQGNALRSAISKMRLRNVSETSLSFDNTIVTGYSNSSCVDDSCKIFTNIGGGISWQTPSSESQTISIPWGFSATKQVAYAGTSNTDLIAVLPNLKKEICIQINARLDISTIAVQGPTTLNKFAGSYAGNAGAMGIGGLATSGCVQYSALGGTAATGTTTDSYTFIQMLLPR